VAAKDRAILTAEPALHHLPRAHLEAPHPSSDVSRQHDGYRAPSRP
jgi:hypothetical protein